MLIGWSVFSEITSAQWTPLVSKARFLLNSLCICSKLLRSRPCFLHSRDPESPACAGTPTASEPDVIKPRCWKPWDRLQESTAVGQTQHPQHPQLERCVPTPHGGVVEGTGILSCCQAPGSFFFGRTSSRSYPERQGEPQVKVSVQAQSWSDRVWSLKILRLASRAVTPGQILRIFSISDWLDTQLVWEPETSDSSGSLCSRATCSCGLC